MDTFIQQLINGLVVGSIYALVALGYTMVYGILGLINFAHGEVVMVGALTALSIIMGLGGSGLPGPLIVLIGILGAIPVCMSLGYVIERVAYRPLRNAPRLAPLITAIGVSILLQQAMMLIWGSVYKPFPPVLPTERYDVGGASINALQIGIVALAAVVMAALVMLVQRTRVGRAMRATAENPAIASLMGVNVNAIISFTFVIGSALGAVAGVMVSANQAIAHYSMGFMLGLKAFTAAVLGGIGNLYGAMLGGILLGLIESFCAGYIADFTNLCWLAEHAPVLNGLFESGCQSVGNAPLMGSNYRDVFAFMVLILVLVFRPSGLMGEKLAERA